MLSPKILLSSIGVLIFNTLKIVQAVEITNCSKYKSINFNSECKGKDPIEYCLKNNVIYGINDSSICTSALTSGTYVFSVNKDGVSSMMNSGSIVEKEDSLIIYQCNTDKEGQICKRTYGYAEIDSKYYEITDTSKEMFKDEDKGLNNASSNTKRTNINRDDKDKGSGTSPNGNYNYGNSTEYDKGSGGSGSGNPEGDNQSNNNPTNIYSETCSDRSKLGLLINHITKGPSFCLNINSIYKVGDVTIKVVGNLNFVKFFWNTRNRESSFISDFNIYSGSSAANVEVLTFSPHVSDPNIKMINIDKWYILVDTSYNCEKENSCISEIQLGVSSNNGNNNDNNNNESSLVNDGMMVTFPRSVYDNKNYLLKINTGNNISTGPFSMVINNIKIPKSFNAGIIVSAIAPDENKKTPALLVFDNFYSKTNYCLDEENYEIISRRMNLCKGYNNCSYYYCDNGVCEPSTNTCPNVMNEVCDPRSYELQTNCDDGYYLVNENGIVKVIDVTGDLFYCENGFCSQISRSGLYKNTDNNVPLIKCSNKFTNEDNYTNQCVGLAYPSEKITKCVSPGDLINKVNDKGENEVHICLFSHEKVKTITFTAEDTDPIFTTSENSLFGLRTNSYNVDRLIVKVDSLSIYIVNGNYLINKNDEIATTANQEGKRYICINNYICLFEYTVGYYYNELRFFDPTVVPYIQCDENKCLTIDITKTSCSSSLANDKSVAKEGELFITTQKDENGDNIVNYNICLDTTVDRPISFDLGNSNNIINDYDIHIYSFDLLISSNNKNSIFPYNPNKYLIGYVKNLDVQLEYRYDLYYQADSDNIIYRKYRMNENDCPKIESIIEYEILCPYDPDYNNRYSYYQRIQE